MLTEKKLEIFTKYKGYYDGYCMQNKNNNMVISDAEWSLLSELIQNIYLIRKGLTSKTFELDTISKLNENCDTENTAKLVYNLEKFING